MNEHNIKALPRPLDATKYPLLADIKAPEDIRSFDTNRLLELCTEIRRFLIEELSSNPGHFASSMGAVELTVALHYVFNTPYDRLVWDVGHQAYGHKLLTGRAPLFYSNRKLGGLAGFPSPDESEYDTFTAGHASNSISAALGMAVASAARKDVPRRNVVAIIGDASISGGLAFEGLNNAANVPNNLLIILNDNDMSIDRNVGSLNSYLAHLTTSKGYNKARFRIYNLLRSLHLVNEKNKGRILRFNNSLKSFLTREQNIFEGLNIRYFGPFDGHDLPRIISVMNDIKDMEGPRILHLRTVKGKGYAPAEKDPAVWHAPGKFDVTTGNRPGTISTDERPKYQDVFGQTLVELAKNDPKIVGVTAAMPSGTSISMLQEVYPERTFDVGISEGHAITFAAGMAREGMKPFVGIYSAFLQRAVDNIVNDASIARLPITICVDRAGIVGEDGVTHHGLLDTGFLSSIPGMTVASPRDADYLRHLMVTAANLNQRGPWAIRYPRGKAETPPTVSPHMIEPGRGERLKDGRDVVVISLGPIASEVTKAIELLNKSGVSVSHYDAIFLKPLDDAMMEEIVAKDVPVVTVEDGSVTCGLGAAVDAWFGEHGLNKSVHRIGVPDRFIAHGTVPQLYKLCGMDSASIAATIENIVKPIKS